MNLCERTECSIHKWYELFKQHTFESLIERIPAEVMSYLQSDGIILPAEAHSAADFSVDCSTADFDDGNNEISELPTFPEFSGKLKEMIGLLGGKVFIKSNWSAPTDSAWITCNKSLECSNIQDIYLLLNSSDKIMENLLTPVKEDSIDNPETSHYVVMKKWQDIEPGTEFRSFVLNSVLIGISQRGIDGFINPQERFDIVKDITDFFKNNIKGKFSLSNYTFDVVRLCKNKITLVDFGVFDETYTKPCLFTWEDLAEIAALNKEEDDPEFRYIDPTETTDVQPSSRMESMFGIPWDFQYLSHQMANSSLLEFIQNEVNTQNTRNQEGQGIDGEDNG